MTMNVSEDQIARIRRLGRLATQTERCGGVVRPINIGRLMSFAPSSRLKPGGGGVILPLEFLQGALGIDMQDGAKQRGIRVTTSIKGVPCSFEIVDYTASRSLPRLE